MTNDVELHRAHEAHKAVVSIEAQLRALGVSIDSSLSELDGNGPSLHCIGTGEPLDQPTQLVEDLAVQWQQALRYRNDLRPGPDPL